jgi:hypothetical protein
MRPNLLHDVGRAGDEPIVRAATGRIRLEIRRVAMELANGALHAEERAAAIFTATAGDAVAFTDVRAQAHGDKEAKQSHGKADEPTNSVAIAAAGGCLVLTSSGIVGLSCCSVIGASTDYNPHDELQHVNRNYNSKEDFKGGRGRILAIRRGIGAKVELHAVQNLTERAGIAPKREATHGMTTPKGATIAQAIAPASRRHIVRATRRRFRENHGVEALTRHHTSIRNANLVRGVVARIDNELVATSQVRRSNDFHRTFLHKFSHGNLRFRRGCIIHHGEL